MTPEQYRYYNRWLLFLVAVALVDAAAFILAAVQVAQDRWALGLTIWLLGLILMAWWSRKFDEKKAEVERLGRK